MPAQKVLIAPRRQRAKGFEGFAKVFFHLGLEFFDSPIVDQVFQTGVAPIIAIAIVPLGGHDRLHRLIDICRSDKANFISHAGKGFFFVVGAPQTTTSIDIEALKMALGICNHHQCQILGEEIYGVIPGTVTQHLNLRGI